VQFVCVLSAAGAGQDIPDTRILLSTGTCWPLQGEIIFTWVVFALVVAANDIASDTQEKLKKK
jgi:hypothetical protein